MANNTSTAKKKGSTTTKRAATAKTESNAAKEPSKNTEAKNTRDEDIELLKQQIELLKRELAEKNAQQVITVSAESEKVYFLWQAEVANDNVLMIGPGGMYGRITGKTGQFFVPKNELSRILDENVRTMLKNRWLMITSGLTEEEREMLGCDYKEGELLDRNAFSKMVEMGDAMIEIYPRLCAGHREMVAKRYMEAFEKSSPYVTRERIVELNKISKKLNEGLSDKDPRKKGDFIKIIEQMNAADAE